jgi:hypothetical protein
MSGSNAGELPSAAGRRGFISDRTLFMTQVTQWGRLRDARRWDIGRRGPELEGPSAMQDDKKKNAFRTEAALEAT